MPATKKLAEISTARSMCGHRQMNDGLKMVFTQSVGTYRPSWKAYPAGVCIQEFAAMIHVDDRNVPIATIAVAANMVACLTGVAVEQDADESRLHEERSDHLHPDDRGDDRPGL